MSIPSRDTATLQQSIEGIETMSAAIETTTTGRVWCPECFGTGYIASLYGDDVEPCDMCAEEATIELLSGGWLARVAGRLVDDMKGAGIEDPLGEPLTLAAVLHDLFTLAGSQAPADIRERIGG